MRGIMTEGEMRGGRGMVTEMECVWNLDRIGMLCYMRVGIGVSICVLVLVVVVVLVVLLVWMALAVRVVVGVLQIDISLIKRAIKGNCCKKTENLMVPTFFWLLFTSHGSSHRSCSIKKVLLKILQYSLENNCVVESFFNKVAVLGKIQNQAIAHG